MKQLIKGGTTYNYHQKAIECFNWLKSKGVNVNENMTIDDIFSLYHKVAMEELRKNISQLNNH